MAETMTFLPRTRILSLEEILRVATQFTQLGVRKIRLTGGEPLVRNDILWLVERIAALPGLHELVMTTNGSQLPRMAAALAAAGVKRLNISLDSLQPARFRELTRTGDLAQVMSGIDAARGAGFQRIKLNAVILKGRNDDEIIELVRFARDQQLDISFIEEMPLGQIAEHDRAECFMASDAIRAIIERHFPLFATTETTPGPSRYFRMSDSSVRIGFISPHSHNFCGDCNRVRLTAEGRLLLCLGNEHSMDLRAALRDPSVDDQQLQGLIRAAMDLKPERHYFDAADHVQPVRFMNMTGG
jgi:cyclic pyranopterin phosphate synthase